MWPETSNPHLAISMPYRSQTPIAERAGIPPHRGFVPWRFSDAGRRACGKVRDGQRPKTSENLHTDGRNRTAGIDT